MNKPEVTIIIPAGLLDESQAQLLRDDLKIHHHSEINSDTRHLIQSKVEAHLRISGALEMPKGLEVNYCEPEPRTETLSLYVERQIMQEDGKWTSWLPVDLKDSDMELKSGQRVRQRVRMRWNRGRAEGQVVEFQI